MPQARALQSRSATEKIGLPPPKRGWAVALLSFVLLLMGAGAVGGLGWLALKLILNPLALSWLNQQFPTSRSLSVYGLGQAQTLTTIRTATEREGKRIGTPITLGTNRSFADPRSRVVDLLLPVLVDRPSCQKPCDQIVELRLYQSAPAEIQTAGEPRYFLVNRLPIVGPEESFVIAPIVDAQSPSQGTPNPLPLTDLHRFNDPVPSKGVWLSLSGQRLRANVPLRYGRVLYYNRDRLRLSALLDWTSTAVEEPIWQEVTGGGEPELIINQTNGMEPRFKIYQVKTASGSPSPFQLEPISLMEPALDRPGYAEALQFARSGLWSTSLQTLRSIRQRNSGKLWTEAAQAQMALVDWHARVTRAQAGQAWASPGQQVLVYLIDGRWTTALDEFSVHPDVQETVALLRADSGRLQSRIEAILRVNPTNREVRTWAALLMAAKQGQRDAIAWLRKQPKVTAAELAQTQQLINRW